MARTFSSLSKAGLILLLTAGANASVLSAQTRDRIPPTAPTRLVATAADSDSVTLSWGPSTDNSGRFNYVICCAGPAVTVQKTATTHTLEGLRPGTTHIFRVYAKDAAGNTSSPSNPVTVTTAGELTVPTKPAVQVPSVGPTHASLTWSSRDDGPTLWYSIYIDGQPVGTVSSRRGTFTCSAVLTETGCVPLEQETTYTFTVEARDVDGNVSLSDPVLVTTHPPHPDDVTPPTPPRNVTVQNSAGPLIVSWEASTDDFAPQSLIRYQVYVNGELSAVVVGETTSTQFESALEIGEISVVAVDTADNESAPGTL